MTSKAACGSSGSATQELTHSLRRFSFSSTDLGSITGRDISSYIGLPVEYDLLEDSSFRRIESLLLSNGCQLVIQREKVIERVSIYSESPEFHIALAFDSRRIDEYDLLGSLCKYLGNFSNKPTEEELPYCSTQDFLALFESGRFVRAWNSGYLYRKIQRLRQQHGRQDRARAEQLQRVEQELSRIFLQEGESSGKAAISADDFAMVLRDALLGKPLSLLLDLSREIGPSGFYKRVRSALEFSENAPQADIPADTGEAVGISRKVA